VFFSGETTTFERSRVFDVDRVDDDELHTIADTIRARFSQQSVLTFEPRSGGNAIRLEVPSVTAQDLREGLLDDQEARERLFGGSVTQDNRLLLIADKADTDLARAFAKAIGGDLKRARTRAGDREFVEGPLPVRVVKRTLIVDGTAGDDAITLARRFVTLNGESFNVQRYDRARVDGGDGLDTLTTDAGHVYAAGDRVRLGDAEFDNVDILRLQGDATVGDLSATDTFQVDVLGADRATVLGSDDDDQISIGSFGILGPTFVRFVDPQPTDRLTVDGRGGDDIISASIATLELTLVGGGGDNVLLGGPGNDRLIGGNGFDDVRGGKGSDVAWLGGHFDRFSWSPGDGNDVIDGGASRDSLSLQGTNAAEQFAIERDGLGARITRDLDGVILPLAGIEEINAVAGGGADTFAVGDLRRSGIELVDISLAPIPITAGGDGQADRVMVTGTDKADAMKLTGKVVVGGTATLTGLPATINISHAESADTLAIDTRGGADTLDTSAFAPGTIGLEVDQPS
jgi:Ca2+-binding RTX toxin-like protein